MSAQTASNNQPQRCLLCNAENSIVTAGFKQIYRQANQQPVLLDWWECSKCKGWFAYPLPTPEIIARHWSTVTYNDINHEKKTAAHKELLQRRILSYLSALPKRGVLLDVGSNFGHFLEMAREQGWQAVGLEPNSEAVAATQSKGFEVHSDWQISDSALAERHFDAIVATDVFYYDWHPFLTLQTFYRMLNPNGMLVMRLTNKYLFLNVERSLLRDSQKRNIRLSKTLKGQFHTLGIRPFRRILADIGFTDVQFHPHATAAPWRELGTGTLSTYLAADVVYALTLGQLNISPGVLLTAHKR